MRPLQKAAGMPLSKAVSSELKLRWLGQLDRGYRLRFWKREERSFKGCYL